MDDELRGRGTTQAGQFYTVKPLRRTGFNRVFAAIYACAILALLYHHVETLLNSKTQVSFSVTLTLLISDLVLAFMWTTSQALRMYPIYWKEFPQNLVMERSDYPALDVFICTADPYKEQPMSVVSTALSVMAYAYPTEKLSVYLSDDGGSAWTLFAFMEAAKFAAHWLPFCRKNNIVDRSPKAYFKSNHSSSPEIKTLKLMYESMKERVEHVVERGKVDAEYINSDKERQALSKWDDKFTRKNHPTVIQVLLENDKDKDASGDFMPNLIYLSREKSQTSNHHFKAGALNVLRGYRYGSLVEDFFTSLHLHCEGWRSIFCNPDKPAFWGDAPISLIDILDQQKRWFIGALEVAFSKYNPLTLGFKTMGPLAALGYSFYAFQPILSIPITVYAFLPQIALLNKVSIFPKVSEPWYLLYGLLIVGAYGQDLFEFISTDGTFLMWWNDQRIWNIRCLSNSLFGSIEFFLRSLGISNVCFNVTSKVIDDDQIKRYNKGIFEFGVHSPMFVPLTMAALINLASFCSGLVDIFRGSNLEGLIVQMFLSGFAILNCLPIYEAMILRSDKGKLQARTTLLSTFLTLSICIVASFIF